MCKSLAGLFFCLPFLVWAAPICLIGRVFIWKSLIIEQILYSILHVSIGYIHILQLLTTLNRLIAVFSYSFYQKVFNMKNVKCMTFFALFPASWMLFFYFVDMNPYFNDNYLGWDMRSTASIHPTTLESYLIWIIMGISCFLDFVAFLKILYDTVGFL